MAVRLSYWLRVVVFMWWSVCAVRVCVRGNRLFCIASDEYIMQRVSERKREGERARYDMKIPMLCRCVCWMRCAWKVWNEIGRSCMHAEHTPHYSSANSLLEQSARCRRVTGQSKKHDKLCVWCVAWPLMHMTHFRAKHISILIDFNCWDVYWQWKKLSIEIIA